MYAVVLAGGGGTRLWPLSRAERPKPFLPLLGSESLLQRTVRRLSPLIEPADVYVVTDRRYVGLVLEQLPDVPAANVLAEPVGRNTAAAVALATLAIDRPDHDVMVVLPADHHILDEAGFRGALEAAARVARGRVAVDAAIDPRPQVAPDGHATPSAEASLSAEDNPLVTLGIRPTGPDTGYGYIVARASHLPGESSQPSEPSEASKALRAFEVERFEEKPEVARAEDLLAAGDAYWNAGIFVWSRGTARRGLQRHAADLHDPIASAVADGVDPESFYGDLRSTSIDYALLEPASLEGQVSIVPLDVGWSDLGSWSALLDHLSSEMGAHQTMVGASRAEDLGSQDVLVHASGTRLVVTIGLRGTIVVDTPDVVLVCARDRAQDVKRIVDRLTAAKETDCL